MLAKAGCPSGRATLLRDSVRFLHRAQRRLTEQQVSASWRAAMRFSASTSSRVCARLTFSQPFLALPVSFQPLRDFLPDFFADFLATS